MSMGINLTNMTFINGYKLDKYGPLSMELEKFGALSMGINLINMTNVNGYKLDKYGPSQWVIVVDKIVNGLE